MSTMVDLLQLIKGDIPDGRSHLQDSCGNLEKVASYCEGNYAQAVEKRQALEETKNYTTQSLASVAYQINTLATNFLHLLDLQTNQLAEMESSINHLSQTVMIHKEKVARREIGVLTTNKSTTRPQGVKNGIIYPAQVERPIKYVRKRIDYKVLDEIGHGVKTQQNKPGPHSTNSTSSNRSSPGQPPNIKPPTPPQARISGLVRQSSPYRTPAPPVSPPSVPSHYAPGHISQNQQRSGQYAAQGQYAGQQQKSHYASQQQQLQQGHYAGQQPPQQSHYAGQQQPQEGHYATRQQVQQMQQGHYATQQNAHQGHYSSQQQMQQPQQTGHYATQQQLQQQMQQQQQQQQQHQGHYGQHVPLQQKPSIGHYGQPQQSVPQTPPPSHYAHRQELQQAAERRASGYAAVGNMQVAPPAPPTGMVQPMQQQPQTPPPPPPVAQQPVPPSPTPPQVQQQSSVDSYEPPPPPPIPDMDYDNRISSASPPLPPPPDQGDTFNFMPPPPDMQYGVDNISNIEQRFQHTSRILPEWVPEEYLEKVVAIYDYDKDKDDELSFTEGAVIYVVKKNDDGWYEGIMDGVAGLFPGNYVESLNELAY